MCQYGLFGEGSLARFFSIPKTGVHIVPVLCIGKLETEHIVEAFELNAQGVFIAACGEERCARQNTEMFAKLKAERAKEIIQGLGLEPERIRLFSGSEKDVGKTLDDFIEVVSKIILKRTLTGER